MIFSHSDAQHVELRCVHAHLHVELNWWHAGSLWVEVVLGDEKGPRDGSTPCIAGFVESGD